MTISIRRNNVAELKGRYRRYLKWKINQLGEKFSFLKGSRIYLKDEGDARNPYRMTMSLKTKGKELVVSSKGNHIKSLTNDIYRRAYRVLTKHRKLTIQR